MLKQEEIEAYKMNEGVRERANTKKAWIKKQYGGLPSHNPIKNPKFLIVEYRFYFS